MDIWIWIVVVIFGVVGTSGIFLYRRRLRANREEPVFHFNCPGCRRRLKFFARQAGHRGMCANCKTNLEFPVPAQVGRK